VTVGERLQANVGNSIPDIIFGLCNGKVETFLTKGEKITVVLNKKLTEMESRKRRNVYVFNFLK
jgi:hypothetical protein